MIIDVLIFIAAIAVLVTAAKFFTNAAEKIGIWLRLPSFVVGIFIVGIGTSLPELISGIVSVSNNVSEIVPGNIIGANISNLLLVTGFAVAISWRPIHLGSTYIYIDLHYLMGSFFVFYMIAYDGRIRAGEALVSAFIFIIYSFYLVRSGIGASRNKESAGIPFPVLAFLFWPQALLLFILEQTTPSAQYSPSHSG